MPATLGYGWHEGSRGEYLAQYFLTALGVSAPVIRQEDIGIDFYCALARKEKKKLSFHSPYLIQHGAVSKQFIYRGRREVDWLFSQRLPLMICTVDQVKTRFRLYSTSAIWLFRHFRGREISQIKLCPGLCRDVREEARSKRKQQGGFAFQIPLGNPVVDLNLDDLDKKRAQATKALASAIRLEQRNLTFDQLGVHVAWWFKGVRPNDSKSLDNCDVTFAWNDTPGQNLSRQIDCLKQVALTLALNLDAQGDQEKLSQLAPVFALFHRASIPPSIIPKLPRTILKHLSAR